MQILWRDLLDGKMAIVCFEEDPDRPGVPFHFVGLNMCYAAYSNEEHTDNVSLFITCIVST